MLQRLFSSSRAEGEAAPAKPPSPASQLAEQGKQVEKLRGYYELARVRKRLHCAGRCCSPRAVGRRHSAGTRGTASGSPYLCPLPCACRAPPVPACLQEAVERAYSKDVARQRGPAAQLYRTALNILLEGLSLPVPSAGLDPTHSNTSKWRADMNQWQQHVLDRLRDLESPAASSSSSGGGAGGGAPANPLLRTQHSLGRGGHLSPSAAAAAAVGARQAGLHGSGGGRGAGVAGVRQGAAAGGGAAAVSRDDKEFEARVLSEVLDSAPSVAWDDVAGLATAKQVSGGGGGGGSRLGSQPGDQLAGWLAGWLAGCVGAGGWQACTAALDVQEGERQQLLWLH